MTLLLATFPVELLTQVAFLAAFLALSAVIWIWVFMRCRRGEPVISLARRRPAPWQGQDVLFIFLMGVLLIIASSSIARAWIGSDIEKQGADQKPELSHPAEQMLRSGDPIAIAIACVMAVIVAPLSEEFFFRVLLQGWLEAVWSRRRRKNRAFRAAPVSWMPIMLPAVLFALMHRRSAEPPHSTQYMTGMFFGQLVAELATVGLAIMLLRFAAKATAADLGWKPEKLPADAKLGLLALLAVIGPLLSFQLVLTSVTRMTGIDYSLDPIPLFLLALVFGVLYHRTHRLAPSLLLHMAFNATSVVLIFT